MPGLVSDQNDRAHEVKVRLAGLNNPQAGIIDVVCFASTLLRHMYVEDLIK